MVILIFVQKLKLKSNCVIAGKPGKPYLTHSSVEKSKGVTIGETTHKAQKNTNLQTNWLIIGSNGFLVTTGKHYGSSATLRVGAKTSAMGHCLLHMNKVALRHVYPFNPEFF